MKFVSTRDNSIVRSFEEAICSGYAPNGGLFVPQKLPKIDSNTLNVWSTLAYPKLASSVLRLFIDPHEIPDKDLERICVQSFSEFENPDHAVPLVRVGDFHVAELFEGPTFCFKDLGMQVVVNLISYFCAKRKTTMTLVVSTTGDTGPAAVRAVSQSTNLSILVHFPQGQISDFQRRQMTTVNSPRVRAVAFEGSGDDMDLPIKRMLAGSDSMTGINSYNIGRPLVQMVHFIWSYLRVVDREKIGTRISFVMPTGAMGNIAGGYMAKKMGLPIDKLVAATNINDISHLVIQTGKFHRAPEMHKTLSEAINIQVPYNFERLLYYLTDENDSLVSDWMTTMDEKARLTLNSEWLELLQRDFDSVRVTDEQLCETLRHVLEKYGYLSDPNTAVAFHAALALEQGNSEIIVMATASPCKFEEAVTYASSTEQWQKYVDKGFPDRAKAILELEEVEPTIYRAQDSLEASQADWEKLARSLVDQLRSR